MANRLLHALRLSGSANLPFRHVFLCLRPVAQGLIWQSRARKNRRQQPPDEGNIGGRQTIIPNESELLTASVLSGKPENPDKPADGNKFSDQ
jgi:hypothetical protein